MSSVIGRFQSSLVTGVQETTFALAANNFDFTLVKVQAPPEYTQLGACLSKNRLQLAEEGALHITARKLGALFKSQIPSTPRLFAAYGHRVSEIARSAKSRS